MRKQLALRHSPPSRWLAPRRPTTFTGTITDDMCGKDHATMKMGSDAKCVAECVKTMHAKYALYDGKDIVRPERPEDAREVRRQEGDRDRNARRATKTIKVDEHRSGEVACPNSRRALLSDLRESGRRPAGLRRLPRRHLPRLRDAARAHRRSGDRVKHSDGHGHEYRVD